MSTQPAVRGWTYEEFANLPDDGNRYEVIAGELYATRSPTSIHSKVVTRLMAKLELFTQEHGLGTLFSAPYDVIFGEGDYLKPDLLFVRREREEIVKDHAMVGAPDLVVEVLSPSTARSDRSPKRERYAAYGVPEYWVVDTDARQVEVFRLSGGDLRQVEVATDFLRWRPAPGGPELVIDVPHLMRAPTDYSRPRSIA
jgi:Uma2 family endonuclease